MRNDRRKEGSVKEYMRNNVGRVSVVIPTYNRAGFIVKCVESVMRSGDIVSDVVIVNDCSTDGTADILEGLKRRYDKVTVVTNRVNKGHSECRNIGARECEGDYLFFLDDDNIIKPNTIRNLLVFMKRKRNAGSVSPLAINVEGRDKRRVWTYGMRFHPWLSIPIQSKPSNVCAILTETCPNAYLMSRYIFFRVGGFDGRLRIYEDSDLQFRMRKVGFFTYILTSATTKHYHGLGKKASELRKLGIERPKRAFWMLYYRCMFWKWHYSTAQWLFVSSVMCPLLATYYSVKALKRGRVDIAVSFYVGWIFGAFASAFTHPIRSSFKGRVSSWR